MRQVHVAAARGWCHCTRSPHRCGVVLLCLSRDRLHECSAMHRVTCDLCWIAISAVLGRHAGARACDVQNPQQGPVQVLVQLLLVCPVALASSVGHFVHLLCSV